MTPERWAQIKEHLFNHERNLPLLYMPLEHPDFADWQVIQPCVERWAMMQRFLTPSGRVLDVGCHTGWFCRQFSAANYEAIGIDKDPVAIEVAREMGPSEVTYHNVNAFEFNVPEVDVILCLSVMMYMFDDVERGWELMKRLSLNCQTMFIDFGGMYSSRLPFTKETFESELIARTAFRRCMQLGVSNLEQRPFFIAHR